MNRGEIWEVDFNPTVGAEIQKIRPAVIISQDGIGNHPLRVVVPITWWQSDFTAMPWMVQLLPSWQNGLGKSSAANTFQVKSVATERLKEKIGQVTAQEMADILAAVVLVIGYR